MREIPLDSTLLPTPEEKPKIPRVAKNWAVTLGLIAILLVITLPIRRYVDSQNLILLYSLCVLIISSVTPGYFYGFVSAVLCTFLFDFFINPPWDAFQYTVKLPITLTMMLVVTVASSAIAAYMKDIIRRLAKQQQQSHFLHQYIQQLMAADHQQEMVAITNQYLALYLERSVVFYLGDPREQNSAFTAFPQDLEEKDFTPVQERRSATHAYQEVHPAGYGTHYNGERPVYYLPLHGRQLVGVAGFSCAHSPLTQGEQEFIHLMTSQAVLALERQFSIEEHQKSQMVSEKERTRNSLLRSISHDLRTPLTGILSASDTLMENDLDLDERERRRLAKDIHDEAQWLIRVVENLLTVTHLAGEDVQLDAAPEVAEEVVGEAVRIIRKWYPDWTVHVRAPEHPLFVPMDATLISQVLLNLLENAVKNSTPNDLIIINLREDDTHAIFEVSDNGTGISEDLLENLFDDVPAASQRRSSDATGGTGLGLSICSSIVHAHGGTISSRNKDAGGAVFTFRLPLERKAHV